MKKLYIGRKCKTLWRGWKLGDFVRNFVAVILGIFITFWGTDLIEERALQRDLKEVVSFVRKEMVSNSEKMQEVAEKMRTERRWIQKFLAHKDNLDALPSDSIAKYGNHPFRITTLQLGDDALEMLKTSGLLKEMKNKELAFRIIELYGIFSDCKNSYDGYNNIKIETLKLLDEIPGYQNVMPRIKNSKECLEFLLAHEKGCYILDRLNSIQNEEGYFETLHEVDEFLVLLDKEYPQ